MQRFALFFTVFCLLVTLQLFWQNIMDDSFRPRRRLLRGQKADAINIMESPKIHVVVVADQAYAQRYTPVFDRMADYAHRHGYSWTVLGKDYFEARDGIIPEECVPYQSFFFLKHCLVAYWMEAENIPDSDAIFVLDSDNIPYRMEASLDDWTRFEETIVLYVRGWSEEITAGNYMVRNTEAGRNFLKAWAHYNVHLPVGFSSYDNGALHIHLLRALGIEPPPRIGTCGMLYHTLKSSATDLTEYWNFVTCARNALGSNSEGDKDDDDRAKMQTFVNGSLSVRLLPQKHGFAVDHHLDQEPTNARGAVFHHNVKVNRDLTIEEHFVKRYNLALPEGYTLV